MRQRVSARPLLADRAKLYSERVQALVDDILREPYDPDGDVYGILVALFKSPVYLQTIGGSPPAQAD